LPIATRASESALKWRIWPQVYEFIPTVQTQESAKARRTHALS
jgi:hypothetical protein